MMNIFVWQIFCSARLACQISFNTEFSLYTGFYGMNEGNLLLCENKINFGLSKQSQTLSLFFCSARDNIESKLESVKHNNTLPEVDQISSFELKRYSETNLGKQQCAAICHSVEEWVAGVTCHILGLHCLQNFFPYLLVFML